MAPDFEDRVLGRVAVNRRKFVRDVVLGTAFAVPAIASFDMRSLSAYAADCLSPNQTEQTQDHKFRIKFLKFDQVFPGDVLRVRLQVHDVDSDRNVGSGHLPVRLRKVKPDPGAHVRLPQEFKFKHTSEGRFYALGLDTRRWDPGQYQLSITVGADKTRFKVFALVGTC
jgi:hypothetical protein